MIDYPVLLIGHSHTLAIKWAWNGKKTHSGDTSGLQLHALTTDHTLLDGYQVRADVIEQVCQMQREASPVCAFLAIGGNIHNVIGLLRHPRSFDFVLESDIDLPLDPQSEIIPAEFVREAMLGMLAEARIMISAFSAALQVPVYHLESPPPIPSEEHIKKNADELFSKALESGSIAPASLRYKLWRLQSELVQEICREHRISWVPAPSQASDKLGYLIEKAWFNDATHANVVYGDFVLAQMRSIAERHQPSLGTVS